MREVNGLKVFGVSRCSACADNCSSYNAVDQRALSNVGMANQTNGHIVLMGRVFLVLHSHCFE